MTTPTRDLREGGTWTAFQRAKNDLIVGALRVALAVACRIDTTKLVALGRILGLGVWAAVPKLRRLAVRNVERTLEDVKQPRRFVRDVYVTLGGLLGEAVAMLDPKRSFAPLPFLPGARECLESALAERRGVVFASAHLGPWERVAGSLVAHGFPLTVVAREPYNPRLRGVYDRLRGGRGVRTVYRGAKGAAIALVRVLRRKEILGIPMDLATRAPSMDAPFLGRPARTAIGPARLALRTNAVVVVGAAAPQEGGGLGMTFVRIDGAGHDEASLTMAINRALGDRIRALPHAWPWMHPRWGPTSSWGRDRGPTSSWGRDRGPTSSWGRDRAQTGVS